MILYVPQSAYFMNTATTPLSHAIASNFESTIKSFRKVVEYDLSTQQDEIFGHDVIVAHLTHGSITHTVEVQIVSKTEYIVRVARTGRKSVCGVASRKALIDLLRREILPDLCAS